MTGPGYLGWKALPQGLPDTGRAVRPEPAPAGPGAVGRRRRSAV